MAVSGGSVLYVTFIEKHGPFIKVWGQTDRSLPLIIEKSLLQMVPQFEQGLCIPTLENIQTGNILYCAKYVDGSYYRARIINVTLLQQNFVEVHFVDFGNREIVPVMNLRMISSFSPGLLTIPPQAKDFTLANVTHHGSSWDTTTLSLISNEIRYSELTYLIVSQIGSSVLIKLFKNNEDFALSLFNRGIVLSIALNAQHMILQSTAGSIVSSPCLSSFQPPTTSPMVVNSRSIQSQSSQPPAPALLTYKGAVIEPGTEYRVYVSYVCDGPCQFSIQLQKYEDNLARLMKELNSMTLQPLEDFPMPGTVCVARCVEDDHICRAVVTNMVDSQYKVFYVDFGNTEVVPIENLFQIPFKYVIPKVMATRYALAGLDRASVTVEMKCAFKEFVCDKLLRMQALPAPARSALPLCNLYDENNVNVLDVLQRVALLAYPKAIPLTRGFSQEVHVSYVHSCSRFFVQIKGKEQELNNLMENLQQICMNGQKLQTIKLDLPCCALFEDDGQWYRAQIINIEESHVRVRYVDFGNEALVTVDQLIKPPGEVVTALLPQAIECCLNGYQNMEDDLERDNILEQLILEQDFTMKVIEMHGNRALVDLFDSSKYNVGSLLLDKLASAKSQVSPILIQENHFIEQRKKRSVDESTNFNRSDRKPLRDQNDRGFERQESWRQSKPPRNDDNFDKPRKEKSWRDNDERVSTDSFDKPNTDHFEKREDKPWKENFDKPRRENFEKPYEKRDGFKKDSWQDEESSSNWKSKPRDGFKKDNWQGDSNANFKSSNRDEIKQDDWEGDGNSNRKSNQKDGFKKDTWGDDNGSNWKSKPKDDASWDNSEKNQRQNNRFNKFSDDNRKPRDRKPFSSEKTGSWGSEDTSNNAVTLKTVTDPAPFTSAFQLPDLINRNEKIVVSWFHDPVHFFCQLYDVQTQFKTMMEDIQNHYCDIKPAASAPIGASVIALFPDDGVMYRARVLEVKGVQYRVQYIDFGNVSNTDKVWPVENKFMNLAAQAICCGLDRISPVGEAWPSPESFSSYFDKEYYYCQFVACNNHNYTVELTSDGVVSVSDALVAAGLAQYTLAEQPYDPSILLGQQIQVIVKDVQSLDAFNVELPNGVLLLCMMHNLATATETFEDTLKQFTENYVLMYVDNVLEDKLEVTLYDLTGTKLNILTPDEGAFDTIDIPCPLPVLYSTINGWVSHVQPLAGGTFTVFIQPAEFADTLAQLLENLFNHYEGVVADEPIQPEIDGIYAVHSADTNWYRGQVTSIEDESVAVTFIDYGNSETVNVTELRNLAPEFFQQHILTLQVSASGADDSFVEQNVLATVYYGENGWEAEIQIQPDEQQQTEPTEQKTEKAEQPGLITSEYASDTKQTPVDVPIQEEALPATDKLEAIPQQIGVLVILSHIDTPSEFYLQQFDSLETINSLQATLQEQVVDFPNLENPAAGILCAAPYSLDQQWYRAQILDADDDITTVRFVDYGNTDVISNDTTSVKTLPPELLSLEQYARRSSLMVEPNGPEWSPAAFERFEQLTAVENLTAEIIHQDEKTTFVKLYADAVDVAEVLVKEGLANKLQLEVESSCTGYVSNLNSPSEFWIQLENSVADLEWIAEQLSSANSFPELEDLTPGCLCAALFPDDEMWYRARILSNTVAGLEVLFIDYGNSCTCISLRQLPEDLIMLPPLAQKCSLQKPTGILQWSQQAIEEFKAISADGATVFTIDKVSTGETYVVRLLLNGEDISEKLLPITEDAYISNFESVASFWIQKLQDVPKLDLVSEKLTEAHDWPEYQGQEGCEFVAALFTEDETWYRARIVNKNETDYEVLFIDYGNTGLASSIHLLSCDIDKIPPLAVNCRIEPLPGFRWSEESSTKLAEINNEGSTLFQVEFVGGDVVRLYLNGCDVRSELDSVPVSVQSSPKKSVAIKTLVEIRSEYQGEEEIESRDVAESILTEIENSFNKEIVSKESLTSTVTSPDLREDVDFSQETAELILAEIEHSVDKIVNSNLIEGDALEKTLQDSSEVNVDAPEELLQGAEADILKKTTQEIVHTIDAPEEIVQDTVEIETNTFTEIVQDAKEDSLEKTTQGSSEIKTNTPEEITEAIAEIDMLETTLEDSVESRINTSEEMGQGTVEEDTLETTLQDSSESKINTSNEIEQDLNEFKINTRLEVALEETLQDLSDIKVNTSEEIVQDIKTISNLASNDQKIPEKVENEDEFDKNINCAHNVGENVTNLDTLLETKENEKRLHKEVPSLDTLSGELIERRASIPHAEKIVPGSICRGDLESSQFIDEIKDTDSNVQETKDTTENCILTKTPVVNIESPCLDMTDTRIKDTDSSLGVSVFKGPSSLSYTEKIVPGSISRGDLSVVDSDSTVEDGKCVNQLKNKTSEETVTDISLEHVEKCSKAESNKK